MKTSFARLAILATLLAASSARADAPKEPKEGMDETWSSFWDECYDLNLPYFQARIKKFIKLLRTGDNWQKALELEKVQITHLNKETCGKWGLSKNGDQTLKDFTAEFSKVAGDAIALKGQINDDIMPQIKAWIEVEGKELKPYGFKFDEFPCGKAFNKTQKSIEGHLAELEQKVLSIREECMKTGDKAVQDAVAKGLTAPKATTYGEGSGKAVPKGTSTNGASDITGLKDDQDKAAKGDAILQQQTEAAQKENAKKKAPAK